MMILTVPTPAFSLGQLVATPGALQALEHAGQCLERFWSVMRVATGATSATPTARKMRGRCARAAA